MNLDDDELLVLLQRGDTGALGMLYVRHSARVHRFAMRFLQNERDAQDLTHDVFFNLWQHRESITSVASLKAYLFTMTRNAIFSIYRHRAIADTYLTDLRDSTDEAIDTTEASITAGDLLTRVNRIIQEMPEPRRTIFTMNRFDHMTYDEIAAALSISKKTVEYHMSRALSALRALTTRK